MVVNFEAGLPGIQNSSAVYLPCILGKEFSPSVFYSLLNRPDNSNHLVFRRIKYKGNVLGTILIIIIIKTN